MKCANASSKFLFKHQYNKYYVYANTWNTVFL